MRRYRDASASAGRRIRARGLVQWGSSWYGAARELVQGGGRRGGGCRSEVETRSVMRSETGRRKKGGGAQRAARQAQGSMKASETEWLGGRVLCAMYSVRAWGAARGWAGAGRRRTWPVDARRAARGVQRKGREKGPLR